MASLPVQKTPSASQTTRVSRLVYRLGEIGICLADGSAYWTADLASHLRGQLEGLESQDVRGIEARIDILPYPPHRSTTGGIATDSHRFGDGIFEDEQNRTALRIGDRVTQFWCADGRQLSIAFLLQCLLVERHETLSHSAAIAVEGTGLLFPAFGGVGKTAFISRVARDSRVTILGDDLIRITATGDLAPYLRPFCLYKHHRALFPDFFSRQPTVFNRSWIGRFSARARRVVLRRLGTFWTPSPHVAQNGYITVAPRHLFPQEKLATAPVPLDRVYLLKRVDGIATPDVRSLSPARAAAFVVAVTYHDLSNSAQVLAAWLAHHGETLESYFGRVQRTVHRALSRARGVYEINIPLCLPMSTAGDVISDIVLGDSRRSDK